MKAIVSTRAKRAFTACAAISLAAGQALADSQPIDVKTPVRANKVSFSREIQPFLEDRCAGCHGSALAENRLNMETVAGMIKGGKRGPAIHPGKGDDSLILKMAARRMTPVMPPVDKPANQPLDPSQLGLLKLWIDQGAKDDSTETETEPTPSLDLMEPSPEIQSINAVDLSPDGARLAAGRSNKVQIQDIDSGLEIITLDGGKDLVQSLRYRPDATILAVGGYQTVTLWSAPIGGQNAIYKGHSGAVSAIAMAGGMLYSAGLDKTIRAWKAGAGTLAQTWPQPVPARAVVATPDGKSLFASYDDGTIRRLDAVKGTEQGILHWHDRAIVDLVILSMTKDGVRLAALSGDGSVSLGLVPNKGPSPADTPHVIKLNGGKAAIRGLAAIHGGKLLVTAGDDGVARIHDGETGMLVRSIPTGRERPIRSLAASREGLLLVGYDDGLARLITLSDGKPVHDLPGGRGTIHAVAFSQRGDRLATADDGGGVKIWDTTTGTGVIAFGSPPTSTGKSAAFSRVVFTDADEVLTASTDGVLTRWWFSGTWKVIRTLGPLRFRVLALDFSPDGALLAAGGGEPAVSGEVNIWEIGKGLLARRLESLHSDTILGLRFSPDGSRLATAAADKFLKVVELKDGKTTRSFEGHTHHVMGVDWQADGKRLVSAGADSVLKLWDYDSGDQIRTFNGPRKSITAVRWRPIDSEIVATSGDGSTRSWNPENPAPKRTFTGTTDYVLCLSISANGGRVAAGCSDGSLLVWDGKTGQALRSITPRTRH